MEAKLRSMFTDPAFYGFSMKDIPNRLYFYQGDGSPGRGRAGIVVARASAAGNDHSLSVAGLDYVLKAKDEGRVDEAFVVLARGQNGSSEFVAAERAEAVKASLADTPPVHGQWGAYWWVAADFNRPSSHRVPF